MSRARNSRWGMLLHVNEAGTDEQMGIAIYRYENLSKWHGVCQALHAKWYPYYTWTWEQVNWRSMSRQNRRCTSTSCWHCNVCMLICWKCIAFDGRYTQSDTHQWGSTKKIQVKHDLGSRLYGGQGQNKIGGAPHQWHVGIAMHAW